MNSLHTSPVRAIILAAGKSSKFFPPLYDKPKGLFTFRNEVLIERQISQLKDAGIEDITVVIGYEKERFFYLKDKYDVDIVVNSKYADESNLSSLYLVKDKLENSYICCADHWYEFNPFNAEGYDHSVRLVQYQSDASREFVVETNEDGRLLSLKTGASSGLCMAGFAYFTEKFAKQFLDIYEKERFYIGINSLFWEEFWGRHSEELQLFGIDSDFGFIEFDSIADLQEMDGRVLENVSQEALLNISNLLRCNYDDIHNIQPLNKGLTNVSFSFVCDSQKYVYRHPGASSSNLVKRDIEVKAQRAAIELGIDGSVIDISPEGWKLSKYIESDRVFDYNDSDLLRRGIEQIKTFHSKTSGLDIDYEINLLEEGKRLLGLASSKKAKIVEENMSLYKDLLQLWHHFELDNWSKVFCHNDTYAVNWIVGEDSLYLIDWEYAGMNDPVNDIATLVVRDDLNDSQTEEVMRLYFEGNITSEQRRHSYACFALCG